MEQRQQKLVVGSEVRKLMNIGVETGGTLEATVAFTEKGKPLPLMQVAQGRGLAWFISAPSIRLSPRKHQGAIFFKIKACQMMVFVWPAGHIVVRCPFWSLS